MSSKTGLANSSIKLLFHAYFYKKKTFFPYHSDDFSELMLKALLENQLDFVRSFIDLGLNLTEFLTMDRLKSLYGLPECKTKITFDDLRNIEVYRDDGGKTAPTLAGVHGLINFCFNCEEYCQYNSVGFAALVLHFGYDCSLRFLIL